MEAGDPQLPGHAGVGALKHSARRAGVEHGRVCGIQRERLDEGMGEPGAARLPRAAGIDALEHPTVVDPCGCRRKIARGLRAGHVGATRGVQRHTESHIVAAAAEIGGVDQRGTRGIELRDKGVDATARQRLERIGGDGKIQGLGPAGHGGIAGSVDGDTRPEVPAGAAEVGGVDQGGGVGIDFGDEQIVGTVVRGAVENLKGVGDGEAGVQRLHAEQGGHHNLLDQVGHRRI